MSKVKDKFKTYKIIEKEVYNVMESGLVRKFYTIFGMYPDQLYHKFFDMYKHNFDYEGNLEWFDCEYTIDDDDLTIMYPYVIGDNVTEEFTISLDEINIDI